MEQVRTMISRFGRLYNYSLAKTLIPKWVFFLTLDCPQSDLVKTPSYFGCSLEQRFEPRHARMKECGVMMALSSLLVVTLTRF